MKCTSAEAAKYLRKLNEDYASLLSREEVRRDFLVSLGEDPRASARRMISGKHRTHWMRWSKRSVG